MFEHGNSSIVLGYALLYNITGWDTRRTGNDDAILCLGVLLEQSLDVVCQAFRRSHRRVAIVHLAFAVDEEFLEVPVFRRSNRDCVHIITEIIYHFMRVMPSCCFDQDERH